MTSLAPIQVALDREAARLPQLLARIGARDHTVWQDDPREVADRLGWLDCPTTTTAELDGLAAFASEVVADGLTDVLLVGMGGSSLFPEVLARTHRPAPGHAALHVLDSTDPGAVLRIERRLELSRTLVVAASKSGTTIETRSHLDHLWAVLADAGHDPAPQVAVITDPGSPLADWGARRHVRRVFTNPPDIGGRFSALSRFGLVPGALLGVDLGHHLAAAGEMLDAALGGDAATGGPAHLGAVLAAAVRSGRDKLTVVLPRELASFGAWIEQLVAESTGKHGVGIVPVVDEPPRPPQEHGDDRLFVGVGGHPAGLDALVAAGHPVVCLPAATPDDLGREVARWELATAVAGALLGINPFDQPDVASAKDATAAVLDDVARSGEPPAVRPDGDADRLLAAVAPGDYVALLAFVDPDGPLAVEVQDAAARLRERFAAPVTVGIGPRYLHSTGQLHKGGPDGGVFLQVVGEDPEDVAVPGRPYGFSTLKRAQAVGDLAALRARDRRAARIAPDAVGELPRS